MKISNKIMTAAALLTAFFLFAHKRVIQAWIRGDEIPDVPAWHPHCKK